MSRTTVAPVDREHHYLSQRGCVLSGVCLSVCPLVSWRLLVKTTDPIFTKISPNICIGGQGRTD